MNLVFKKFSSTVLVSPDSEGLGAAVKACVGSNLTQLSNLHMRLSTRAYEIL